MQTEFIKQFIGYKCVISLMTGDIKYSGVITDVESFWIKIQEDDCIRVINVVAVRDIQVLDKMCNK